MNVEEDCIFYYSSKIHKFLMKARLLCLLCFCAFATKSSKMCLLASPCMCVLDSAVTAGVEVKCFHQTGSSVSFNVVLFGCG